ncbi:MAG: hydroxymethylbilane synthase [Candidatus Nitrosopelagicus sp.]|nr:hydroxymethylbilane synthase [Candidatus Nitrosopelagicus sp.]
MNFTVGARGSKLSIAQTDWVISELQKTDSSLSFDIKPITTKGDTDTRPLFAMEQKGIFEKEIDRAVFEKEVDFAVHSLKDVPSQLDPNLIISCIPKREAVNDVLITRDGFDIEEIPSGSVIGSSSLRRAVQVTRKRPDVIVKPVRGNIETRIKKVEEGKFDGIVLAQAGITRLGTDIKISKLPTNDFVPSPGQGALAIVSRKDNSSTLQMLKKIEDYRSRMEIEAERALSNSVDSGCRFPVGAIATSDANSLTLKVAVYSMDGKKSIILEKTGSIEEPHVLGRLLGDELRDRGVKEIASNWREELEEWNKQ